MHFAFIIPFDPSYKFSRARIEPAVRLTLEEVSKQLLPNSSLQATFDDSKCSSIQAPLAAITMYSMPRPLVFMGPVCDYATAPVARYSTYWKIPVVSPGAFAHDFGLKKSGAPSR